ncbi:MAG: hypothetical protein ACJZ72_08155 [Opitutales bacterium]
MKFSCYKFFYSLLLFYLIPLSGQDAGELHPWTDLNGRTLQAKFIQGNDSSVTIEWNGQRFDLPINTLSDESKALAKKFIENSPAFPRTAVDSQQWKDTAGRTIQAKFIKSDKLTVTLNWNGKTTVLPLSMFDQESQRMAARLQRENVSEPVSSKSNPVVKVDLNGELDLFAEYPWANSAGKTVNGRFLDVSKDDVKLSINRGTREVSIPLASLAKDSQSLAQKLKIMRAKAQKAGASLAKKRKTMKVPAVTDADLEIEHEFKDVEGRTVKAQFIDADDQTVSVVIKTSSRNAIPLPWDKFDSESIAKLEALRRKKLEISSRKPKIIPAKGNRLSYYGNGKYKDYNTVFEGDSYTIGLPYSGSGLHVWINPGADKLPDHAKGNPLGLRRMSISFNSRFVDRTDPKRKRNRTRKISSFDSSPEPSLEREKITLTGKYDNGGTFEYNMEINRNGMQFWSRIKDPPSNEWPTYTSVVVSLHGVVPNVKDTPMAKIKSQIGDGAFYMTPVEGKRIKLPFDQKWIDLKIPRGALSSLKGVEVMGSPYYQFKFNISPNNGKDMNFNYSKGYGGTFPFQGINLGYSSKEKRTEVPRSRSLKVSVTKK